MAFTSCSRTIEHAPRGSLRRNATPEDRAAAAAAIEEAAAQSRRVEPGATETFPEPQLDAPPAAPARLSSLEPTLILQIGKSRLVELDRPVTRVSVGDPEIAELVLVSPTEVLINGRKSGDTSLILWDQRGVPEVHTLTIGESSDRQVLLEVTVAELNRTAMEEHGVDYRVLRTDLGLIFQPGKIAPVTGLFPTTPPNPLFQQQLGDSVTLGVVDPKRDIAVFLEAIQREGLGKILAQPHLIARSGQEAKFLSGGEIPIIIAEALQTSITFKEFGVRVKFKPTVRDNDTIDLEVAPEVSEPDFANGVTLFGFRVPAFITRRADTRVVLRNGETLVLAGLFRETRSENEQKVPYLGDIPGLGYLFRRTTYNRQKNELMIIVHPRLAEPLAPGADVALYDRAPLLRGEVRSQATDAGVSRPRFTPTLPPQPQERGPALGLGGEAQPVGYTVQVGATRDRAAADAIVAQLRARGVDAYVVAVNSGGADLYRIRVGRYATLEEATAEAEHLRRDAAVTEAVVVSD
jgi:pilus assembly protein CpaC